MIRTTRRSFLKQTAALGGAALLPPGLALGQDAAPPALAIARAGGERSADAELGPLARRLTREALAALGGMERFVSKGDVVWIKPNIGWNRAPELAACTNPDVVAELVTLCLAAGAKTVKVGDHPCHQAAQTYRTSGIAAAAAAAGAELVFLDASRFRTVALGGERLKEWALYPEIIEADLVINVPVAKHHGLARATLAMKNYMGVIGGRRNAWHQDLDQCLVDITAYMKPRLCVLDAVRVLTAHGPVGGNPDDVKRLDTVAAATDIVALDALGAELLGHRPVDIASIRAAEAAALGTADWRSLPHAEREVS